MVAITRALGLLAAATACIAGTTSAQPQAGNATVARFMADAASGFEECPLAPAKPEDRRKDKTKLKYATYNAEFLFLVGYGQLNCPGSDCKWADVDAAREHIREIARNIKKIDADIIQLDEIEDCVVLKTLVGELQALGDNTYKPYLIGGTDTSTGQNVGLITRVDPIEALRRSEDKASLPVTNSKCPKGKAPNGKTKGVAKHFYTKFQVAGFSKPVTVIGAHFLANPTDKVRCFEREGQASVIANIAKNAVGGSHVIISGDLNDWSASALDSNNNRPISNALGLLEAPGFTNVASMEAKNERFTQWYDKNQDCVYSPTEVSSLDHVIVSNSLKRGISNVEFRNDLYQASCGGYDSDHFPIMVTINAV